MSDSSDKEKARSKARKYALDLASSELASLASTHWDIELDSDVDVRDVQKELIKLSNRLFAEKESLEK